MRIRAPATINAGLGIPYALANSKLTAHWLADTPLPAAWIRAPGRMQNTFGNESFLDEIAAATASIRSRSALRHLTDPRGLELLERLREAREMGAARLARRATPARSRADAACPTRSTSWCGPMSAIVADVTVDRHDGRIKVDRVFVVHDCGQIINPDGLRNQIEGNVVQTVSRTLVEKLTFSRSAVTSLNWGSYPILTFPECARGRDRPDRPAERDALGCGRADDVGRALGDRECGVRCDRRAVAIGAVQARPGAGGIESRKAGIAGGKPCRHQTMELKTTSRPPFFARTWHSTATRTKSWRSQRRGLAARSLVAGTVGGSAARDLDCFLFLHFSAARRRWMSDTPA